MAILVTASLALPYVPPPETVTRFYGRARKRPGDLALEFDALP